jgi:quercetin dioxygenase-like cupin family protein
MLSPAGNITRGRAGPRHAGRLTVSCTSLVEGNRGEMVTSYIKLACLISLVATSAAAQTTSCEPVSQRAGRELGCFITARTELVALPRDTALYWHIDGFPTESQAHAARSARGTVVRSLGRIWLFTIADAQWRPSAGKRIAKVGPLPLTDAQAHAAVYMEGVFRPGMQSPVHRHPGVEAWYTLEGEQCLETPTGTLVQRAGDSGVMVPGGVPMILTGAGKGLRRSLVLILQDARLPRSTVATDWKPAGLCR